MEEIVWSFDGGNAIKSETKDDILVKRFYFEQNNSIECLEKKYTIKSSSNLNPKSNDVPSKEVNCDVKEILKSYQNLLKISHTTDEGVYSAIRE